MARRFRVIRRDTPNGRSARLAMHEAFLDKFWIRVQKGDGCWLWIGSRLPTGYGRFYPNGRVGMYAHRVSWEIANNHQIPHGLCVMHSCDTPACVNPEHLRVGTQAENMQDMFERGRQGYYGSPGEKHPNSKLTNEQVREIREMWRTRRSSGLTKVEIGRMYGVTKNNIDLIVRRISWKSV